VTRLRKMMLEELHWHSNPIAHRVRRKRQRLPPSLLIENASDRDPAPPQQSAPRRFRSRLATIRELVAIRALPDPAVDQAAPSDHIDDTLL